MDPNHVLIPTLKQLLYVLQNWHEANPNDVTYGEIQQLKSLLSITIKSSKSVLTKLDSCKRQMKQELEHELKRSCEELPTIIVCSPQNTQKQHEGETCIPQGKQRTKRTRLSLSQQPVTWRSRADTHCKPIMDWTSECATIWEALKNHTYSWIFLQPVDAVKLNLPDYHQIIKKPMDLGTIKKKLDEQEYNSPHQFAKDVRLTFSNAMKYNPKGQDAHTMAFVMSYMFEKHWKGFTSKIRRFKWDTKRANAQLQTHIICPNTPLDEGSESSQTQNQILKPTAKDTGCENNMNLISDNANRSCKIPNGSSSDFVDRKSTTSILKGDANTGRLKIKNLRSGESLDSCSRPTSITHKKGGSAILIGGITVENVTSHSAAGAQGINGAQDTDKSGSSASNLEDEYVDIGEEVQVSSFPPVIIDKGGSPVSTSTSCSNSSQTSSSDSESDAESVKSHISDQASPSEGPSCGDSKIVPSSLHDNVINDMGKQENQLSPARLARNAHLKSRFAETILKAEHLLQDKQVAANTVKKSREREDHWQPRKSDIEAEEKQAQALVAANEKLQQREADRQAARRELDKIEATARTSPRHDIMEGLDMRGSFCNSDTFLAELGFSIEKREADRQAARHKIEAAAQPSSCHDSMEGLDSMVSFCNSDTFLTELGSSIEKLLDSTAV